MNTIPRHGEFVLLSSLSNISHGGEMVDITDYVSDEIKNISINSIAAIPGLYSGGVDIMMKNFEDLNPSVIEINAWPMLQSTIYPTYGKAHKPQEYFFNAYFSLDSFFNNSEHSYIIPNSESYVKTYVDFQDLKIELYEKQLLIQQ